MMECNGIPCIPNEYVSGKERRIRIERHAFHEKFLQPERFRFETIPGV